MTNVGNILTVSLIQALTESDVAGRTFLMAPLVATRPNVGSGETVIIIDVPVKVPLSLPAFEQPSYRGVIDTNLALTLASITLVQNTYSTDVEFALTEGIFGNMHCSKGYF